MKSITFRAQMVRALLKGQKTQTRRPVRDGQPTSRYQEGDLCYVREAYRLPKMWDHLTPAEYVHKSFVDIIVWYEASLNERPSWTGRYRHARFMPYGLARRAIKITAVRQEKLLAISEADAHAEGFDSRTEFLSYWSDLYTGGPYCAEANPNVWVIAFV